MLPTFFLAGAAKAGTTSLHHYLGEHPDIFMSEVKEPHYFSCEDDGWPRWAVRDRSTYEALFDAAMPGQARGESSTWTLYSEGAPKRIAQAIPDARIIALLRNPPDRAFSNWAFNFGLGYDSIDTFEAALDAEIAVAVVWNEEEAAQLPTRFDLWIVPEERGDVLAMVEDGLLLALPIVALHPQGEDCPAPPMSYGSEHEQSALASPVDEQSDNPFKILEQLKNRSERE